MKTQIPLDKANGCKKGTMAQFRQKQVDKKGRGSQTPGVKKEWYCQLSPLFGRPRKSWIRSRSYKNKRYSEWCKLMSGLKGNGGSK
jgi:hypothetical protein